MIIWDLLFPRRCPVCGGIVAPFGELICRTCIPRLVPVRQPACRRCGKEVPGQHQEYCLDCARHKRTFDSGAALFHYNEAARHSLAAVKYKNRREYLDFYAAAMHYRFEKLIRHWQPDMLIPVPVHPSRRRQRGYNQAEELAVRLGKAWNIPVCTRLLLRTRKTAPQRDLNPTERLRNLQEAFQVHPDYLSDTQSTAFSCKKIPVCIVLIDDIYTTGSTIEACSRVLKAAGIREIHYLSICIGDGK